MKNAKKSAPAAPLLATPPPLGDPGAGSQAKSHSLTLKKPVSHPPRGVLFYRLQYRQISDPAEAAQALAALKKQAATAFSERNGAVKSLYISSHRARAGALADQKLLAARGLKTTLVEARVVLAQRDIRIDGLRHADAVNAVAALKKRGLDPRLSRS